MVIYVKPALTGGRNPRVKEMTPKVLECTAPDELAKMRKHIEEDLRLSQEIHNLLTAHFTALISSLDRINQTLMKIFTYGLLIAVGAWALDHFGAEQITSIIQAVKADG